MTAPPAPVPRGDETELYRRYATRLRATVTREVNSSPATIDDACAFAWLQLLRYQPARETVLGWLCKTAIREAIKLDRRDRRDRRTVGPSPDTGEPMDPVDPRSPLDDRVELLAAREAIASACLREREAQLLALHAAGYTYKEIANAKTLSERTVERQLLRAKRKLTHARRAQGG